MKVLRSRLRPQEKRVLLCVENKTRIIEILINDWIDFIICKINKIYYLWLFGMLELKFNWLSVCWKAATTHTKQEKPRVPWNGPAMLVGLHECECVVYVESTSQQRNVKRWKKKEREREQERKMCSCALGMIVSVRDFRGSQQAFFSLICSFAVVGRLTTFWVSFTTA